MSDPPEPLMLPPEDGELLSAWLAGDLDERESAQLEERLATDPHLAAHLDATAEVLVGLRRLDEVPPPPGYDERLRARLAAEQGADRPDGMGGTLEDELAGMLRETGTVPDGAAVPVPVGDGALRRRTGRSVPGPRQARRREQRARFPRWPAVAAVALVACAVVALPFLRSTPVQDLAVGGDEEAATLARPPALAEQVQPPVVVEDAAVTATLEATPEGAAEDAVQEDADVQDTLAAEEAEPGGRIAPDPVRPHAGEADEGDARVQDGWPATTDEVRERFTGLPEASDILDLPADEAPAVAARYRRAIEQSPPFPSGVDPAACLPAILQEDTASVPVRVESFLYAGRPALAYVVVTVSQGADTLDRVEVWIVRPETCGPEAFVAV